MEKKKLFLLSGALGLVAVVLVNSYISGKQTELLKMSTPIEVVVAARDIPEGSRLQDSMLEKVLIPKKFLQPDVMRTFDEVRDRQVSVPLLRGTQILGSMMSLNQNIGLSQKIPKKSLAMAISVDNTSGVAGLVQPGDLVDVSVTVEVVKGKAKAGEAGQELSHTEMMTKGILSKVKVLAVDQRSHRSRAGSGVITSTDQKGTGFSFSSSSNSGRAGKNAIATVTLALDAKQVSKLTLAQELGKVSLALHSSWSDQQVSNDVNNQVGEYELLGIDKPIVKRSVDVFYGASKRR